MRFYRAQDSPTLPLMFISGYVNMGKKFSICFIKIIEIVFKLDVFTQPHVNIAKSQSECALYLNYFINN
jgi:hypothetical protein